MKIRRHKGETPSKDFFKIICPLCKGHKEVIVTKDSEGYWTTLDFEEFKRIFDQVKAEESAKARAAKVELAKRRKR